MSFHEGYDWNNRCAHCMAGAAEYRALHLEFEYSAEYRPVDPNIELYIRSLNIVLNIDLEDRK